MVLICQDDYLMQIRVLGSFFTVGFFCWWILGFGVFLMLVATRQSFLLTLVPHGKSTMQSIGMIGF